MLAGRMKLSHFLLIAGLVGAAGIAIAYVAWPDGPEPGEGVTAVAQTAVKTPPSPEPMAAASPQPASATGAGGAEAASPAVGEAGGAGSGPAMRDVDKAVMAWAGKDLGKKKIKDAIKGRGFKVNLYQDSGKSAVNRAKVDLDRDDKWDEKWTFDGANVSRKVSPNDDEDYTESSVWDGSQWVSQ